MIIEDVKAIDALELFTSLGRLEAPARSGPGRFTATWHPPDEGFPQLALFTAHVRQDGRWRILHGVLPLWGLGDAVVKATSFARITVRIGDRRFGPVRTDAAGVARVPVEVRPGETSAWHGAREIPLGVPTGTRALASAATRSLESAGEAQVTVSLFAVTPSGDPLPSPRWKVTVDRGSVSAPAPDGAGGVVVVWSVPAGAPGTVALRAKLEGAPEVSATLALPVVEVARPPPPSLPHANRLTMSVAPRIGVVSNFHDVSAPELAVEAHAQIAAGPGQVLLGAGLGTFAFAPPPNAFGATGATRYLPLLAQAGYRLPISEPFAVAALVEGGVARVSDALQLPGEPRVEGSSWVPAGAAGARVELGVWRGAAALTVRGLWAGDPALPTLTGRFAGLSAAVGYRLQLL
ncbi:MAG: hypothetical protein IRZ16_20135 [Myxococcaceae bacterium]|nr:hypothetical protein [Myxococcaceae bacterium]